MPEVDDDGIPVTDQVEWERHNIEPLQGIEAALGIPLALEHARRCSRCTSENGVVHVVGVSVGRSRAG